MKLSYLFIFLFLISFVSANLVLNPPSLNKVVWVDNTETLNISIMNNYSFDIHRLTIENNSYLRFSEIGYIPPKSEKSITLKISTNSEFTSDYQPKLYFMYYTSQTTPIKTYYVNITNDKYEPTYINLSRGDSIIFTNLGTTTKTVTSSSFDYQIPINQSQAIQFNTVGDITYSNNLGFLFYGYAKVYEKSDLILTHNANYDTIYPIHLESNLIDTEMSYEILDTDFTIIYNKTDEGLIKVRNNGNKPALNIEFTADKWATFNKNLFNLSINTNEYVTFTIRPSIAETRDTNKTYTIGITMKGLNIATSTKNVYVTIPYNDFTDYGNMSYAECVEQVKQFRDFISNIDFDRECVTVEQSACPITSVNYTAQDIYESMTYKQEDREKLQTAINLLQAIVTDMGLSKEDIAKIEENFNLTLSEAEQEKKSSRNQTIFWLTLLGIAILCLVGYGVYYYVIKYKQYESLKERQGGLK